MSTCFIVYLIAVIMYILFLCHYSLLVDGARGARSPRSHFDVILIITSRAFGARNPRSHYDVILIVTSFPTKLATPTVADVCYIEIVAVKWLLLLLV